MNQFTEHEQRAANILAQEARSHANSYADKKDLQAATVAVLCEALKIAGGENFLNPMESE